MGLTADTAQRKSKPLSTSSASTMHLHTVGTGSRGVYKLPLQEAQTFEPELIVELVREARLDEVF